MSSILCLILWVGAQDKGGSQSSKAETVSHSTVSANENLHKEAETSSQTTVSREENLQTEAETTTTSCSVGFSENCKYIKGYNEGGLFNGKTLDECLELCCADPMCKSFDHSLIYKENCGISYKAKDEVEEYFLSIMECKDSSWGYTEIKRSSEMTTQLKTKITEDSTTGVTATSTTMTTSSNTSKTTNYNNTANTTTTTTTPTKTSENEPAKWCKSALNGQKEDLEEIIETTESVYQELSSYCTDTKYLESGVAYARNTLYTIVYSNISSSAEECSCICFSDPECQTWVFRGKLYNLIRTTNKLLTNSLFSFKKWFTILPY